MADVLAVIRDVAIIVLAILNIVLVSILVFVAIQVWRLVGSVRGELPTLTGAARRTLTTVEGTVDFLGTTAARPTIESVSFLVGVRRFLRVLVFGQRRGVRR